MLRWFKNLFVKDWTIHPCGCKSYQGTFTPLEFVYCDACDKKRLEEARNRPAPARRDDGTDYIYGPIPDCHAPDCHAPDCGSHGGDCGGGDGGGGGD